MVKVLFVCLGNICRSPLGEGVMQKRIDAMGAAGARFAADSAGTSDWHVGEQPDARAREAASRHGMDIHHQRGRQLRRDDFLEFDYILTMDEQNLLDAMALRPADATARLSLLLDYAPQLPGRSVPDPYWSGPEAFDEVIAMIEAAVDGLMAEIEAESVSG